MTPKKNQLAYQEAAVRNANAIELVIMLYDILARDLQGAIDALNAKDIETRSKKLKHGFLALQQLEGKLNLEEGGEFDTNMSRFYSMIRMQMMRAQVEQDPKILQELIQLIFSVREAWVEVNSKQPTSAPPVQDSLQISKTAYTQAEAHTTRWKA